jgi:ABC-type transport system involved in multi-copper enzyme maturation permease subunit
MIGRIWTAYKVEVSKALQLKFTFIGPVLVALGVVVTILAGAEVGDVLFDTENGEGSAAYAFIGASTWALNLLGLLLLLCYSASLVSSELSSGTIRTVLVRPILRHEFLVAKLMMGVTYALLIVVAFAVPAWTLVMVKSGFAGISIGGADLYTSRDMYVTFLIALGVGLVSQMAAVAFAVMISTLTRNSGAAIGTTLGIWIAMDTLKYPLRIAPFLFSSYMEMPWQVFGDRTNGLVAAWTPDIYKSLGSSCVWTLLFVVVAILVLRRRSLQT